MTDILTIEKTKKGKGAKNGPLKDANQLPLKNLSLYQSWARRTVLICLQQFFEDKNSFRDLKNCINFSTLLEISPHWHQSKWMHLKGITNRVFVATRTVIHFFLNYLPKADKCWHRSDLLLIFSWIIGRRLNWLTQLNLRIQLNILH